MIATALHKLPVLCTGSQFFTFDAPPGQTCGEYMDSYLRHGGLGYLADNTTQICRYCPYKSGDEFLTSLELSYGDRWRELGIFTCFIASNLAILLLGVSLNSV